MDMSTNSEFSWSEMLAELFLETCLYLSCGDLLQTRLVCKNWNDIVYPEFKKKFKLTINRCNVATLHDILQNDEEFSRRLIYDTLEIHEVQRSDELQSVLKSLGSKIHEVYIYKSPILNILSDFLTQSETLSIRDACVLESDDLASFDLSKFKNLKSLAIKNFYVSNVILNDIMRQLTQPGIVKLEKLCIDITQHEQQETLCIILQLHSKTLTHLEINFAAPIWVRNFQSTQKFSELVHLEFFKLTRGSKECLSDIVYALPKEAPLRNFCLHKTYPIDLISVVADKWSGSLTKIELIQCYSLENEKLKDMRVLRYNLRSLSIINFFPIAVNGLLPGLASETNNILKTLIYGNLNSHFNDTFNMKLLVQRLPRLTTLSFDGDVDDTFLSCIFRHLLHLQHLNLEHCVQITDDGLIGFGSNPAPITNLRGLQSLNFYNANKITDKSLIECFKFIELYKLGLNWCPQISSNGIREMVKNCPALVEISFSNSSIDDDSILHIAQSLPRLRRLNVDYCEPLTSKFIDYIVEHCKSLKFLSMHPLRSIWNKENMKKLADCGISIRSIHIY